jgi:hypothetical protein
MQKIKCARQDERMPVQNPGFNSPPVTRHFSASLGWKKFFWKNEAKLCPSLLTIVKKRTQNEPK